MGRGISRYLLFVVLSIAMGGLIIGVQSASADCSANPPVMDPAANCIQDVFQQNGNTQTINCNANDVSIASVQSITPVSGLTDKGGGTFSCVTGTDIEFYANFKVELTAQARYDIGLYLATGGTQAKTGACNTSVLTSTNASPFINLDAAPDQCGDINAANNPQIVTMDIKAKCVAGANNELALPNCTSWRQPGSNEICTTNADGTDVCDAFPGSPSKCNCDNTFTVPQVTVTLPTGSVTKTPEALAVCAVVRFDVKVHNSDGDEYLKALCDDRFGDITDGTGATCTTTNNLGLTCTPDPNAIPPVTCDCTPDPNADPPVTCPDQHSAIKTTDCTLTATTGTLIAQGADDFTCHFDAEICDFPHSNTVTATLTNTGGTAYKSGSATVYGAKVCLTAADCQ